MFYMDLMCILLTFDNIEGFFNIQNFSLGKPSSRGSKSPQLKDLAFRDEGGGVRIFKSFPNANVDFKFSSGIFIF